MIAMGIAFLLSLAFDPIPAVIVHMFPVYFRFFPLFPTILSPSVPMSPKTPGGSSLTILGGTPVGKPLGRAVVAVGMALASRLIMRRTFSAISRSSISSTVVHDGFGMVLYLRLSIYGHCGEEQ